jgi:hypothetical protein
MAPSLQAIVQIVGPNFRHAGHAVLFMRQMGDETHRLIVEDETVGLP